MTAVYAFNHGGPHLLEIHRDALTIACVLDGRAVGGFLAWPGRVVRLPVTVNRAGRVDANRLEISIRIRRRSLEARLGPQALVEIPPRDVTAARLTAWSCFRAVEFVPAMRPLRTAMAMTVPILVAVLATIFKAPMLPGIWAAMVALAAALGLAFGRERLVISPAWGLAGWLPSGRGVFGWLPMPVILSWDAIFDVRLAGPRATILVDAESTRAAAVTTSATSAGIDGLMFLRAAFRQGMLISDAATKAADHAAKWRRGMSLRVAVPVLGGGGAVLVALAPRLGGPEPATIAVTMFGLVLLVACAASVRRLIGGRRWRRHVSAPPAVSLDRDPLPQR